MPIEVNGKTFETDEEGYLANINDWEPGVAEVMAKENDLDLSDAQLQAFGRGFNLYAHFGHGGGADVSYLDLGDIHALNNGPRNGVFVTTACFSGAFHTEEQSGGEAFVAWVRDKGRDLLDFKLEVLRTRYDLGRDAGVARAADDMLYEAKGGRDRVTR